MKALILAAGLGTRLEPLTRDIPKALVEVDGVKLIDRVLNFIDHPEITEIGVVGGYCFDELAIHLKGRKLKLFKNPDFKLGNIYTLITAFDFLDDDFLMLNVDHIYPKKLLDHVINNVRGITAMCDFDRNLAADDMKVKLDSGRTLIKISKTLSNFDGGYIGMTFCSREMLEKYKRGALETRDIYGKDSCVEFILGHLAANDIRINICDTSGFRWPEVDTKEDLELAEKVLRKDN